MLAPDEWTNDELIGPPSLAIDRQSSVAGQRSSVFGRWSFVPRHSFGRCFDVGILHRKRHSMAPGVVQHGFGTGDPSQAVSQYDVSRLTTPCSAAKMR
jgi:hypothetical protein